ncbi:MAG: hypothetical protein D6781_08185 [Verrucomicrobia bacterium]|nr:MAG: hypothetical protein D6781_08185 [Verrucomicrobiota bacterium]
MAAVLAWGPGVMMATAGEFAPRKNFGARLEPVDQVYNGGGQDAQGFHEFAGALGADRHPILYMTYVGLTPSVEDGGTAGTPEGIRAWGEELGETLAALPFREVMPQIGLSMVGGRDSGAGRDHEVAAGVFDANIEAFVEAVAALGRPALVRIGYECEGAWNGYKPDSYRAAFIRVTQALRERGLPVATVWCVAGGSSGTREVEALMSWYPGDEWVDWWSIDIFSREEIDAPLTAAFCERAGAHGKPVLIGESTPRYVGVLDGRASWEAWFEPFFALVRRQPEIKGICYINWEWREWSERLGFPWHDWGDARIERNAHVREAYRGEMALPLYRHARE